jgi:hypothetical protein
VGAKVIRRKEKWRKKRKQVKKERKERKERKTARKKERKLKKEMLEGRGDTEGGGGKKEMWGWLVWGGKAGGGGEREMKEFVKSPPPFVSPQIAVIINGMEFYIRPGIPKPKPIARVFVDPLF